MKKGLIAIFAMFSAVLFAAPEEVRVTSFDPDRSNATAAIQQALDSGAKRVIIDDPGFDYLITTIYPRSNQEIIVQDNVLVRAIKGEHKHGGANLVIMNGVNNVILRGEGSAEFRMNKRDYQNPALYGRAEWRHLLSITGCKNIVVRDITLSSSGGDGIYVSGNSTEVASYNVLIENVVSSDHHRQACSVISAKDLTIRNCRFIDTWGTPPAAGIDFEPNNGKQLLVNCLVENTIFSGNQGGGGGGGLHFGMTEPISITFRNCQFSDNPAGGVGLWVGGSKDVKLTGKILFENCLIANNRTNALFFNNQRDGGLEIVFRNCRVIHTSENSNLAVINTDFEDNIANIDFGDMDIDFSGKANTNLFAIGSLGAAGMVDIKGKFAITNADGSTGSFDVSSLCEKYKPNPELRQVESQVPELQGLKPVSEKGEPRWTPALRGANTIYVYASPEKPAELEFDVVFSREGYKIPVTVMDAMGTPTPVEQFVINAKEFKYTFTPKYAGVFQFNINTACAVKVRAFTPGWGIACHKRVGFFGAGWALKMEERTNTIADAQDIFDLYIKVNKEADAVSAEFYAFPGEPLQAEVLTMDGKSLYKTDYNYGVFLLKHDREPGKEEILHVRLRGLEDHSIRLGAPLDAIVYTDPANMLTR